MEVLKPQQYTTKRNEWWGWFGSMVWLFFMTYGISEGIGHFGPGEITILLFYIVFIASIAFFSLRYSRDPDGLSKLAHITAPVAIVIAAVFILLPELPGSALYIASPFFFAPALARRVYGVLLTSEPGNRITRYMGGIVACVAVFTAWIIFEPPSEIAFLIPALLSIPAWAGIRRSISLPDAHNPRPVKGSFQVSKQLILIVAVAVVSLLWLDMINSMINASIFYEGIYEENPIYIILGLVLPLVGFLLYGIAHDKGYERIGFICGMGLCVAGLLLAFLFGGSIEDVILLLAFTDGLGGTYTEFFILTIPVFFFVGSNRFVFIASLGVLANLLSSAVIWLVYEVWMPEVFLTPNVFMFVSGAIAAAVFIVLVCVIFSQYREKTLAAALYALLRGREAARDSESDTGEPAGLAEMQTMAGLGFTEEEKKIVLLLIDGNTRSDILRKLHMSAAEVNGYENTIRRKLFNMGDPDPVVAAIVAEYNLTKRETEILRCLRREMTNPEIAAELFVSEGTVKFHVRNLLLKLNVETRRELAERFATFES